MKTMSLVVFIVASSVLTFSQKQNVDEEKRAIKQAALDYAEGFYEGNADRMERGVHPLLLKRGMFRSQSPEGFILNQMNSAMLVEITRTGRGKLDPAKRNISFDVLDLSESTAAARIFTVGFNDYLHLVKDNGQWRIANVLWTNPVPQRTTSLESEADAIKKAIEEFQSKAEAKDVDGVARLAYPGIAKRSYRAVMPGGKKVLQEMDADVILEAVRAGRVTGQPEPTVNVLDVYENMASVKLSTDKGGDYLLLAKLGGQWKIVTGLAF